MTAESNGRLDRIEAALDRLTERHEALAQSFELQQRAAAETDKRLAEERGFLMDALRTLSTLVRSHENRIDKLER